MFQRNAKNRVKRSKFDLSHERKMSLNMGKLTPILVQEILPGDKFRVNSEVMMRLAPMLAPVMHRINVYTHYFFVPNRLIWDEWEDFITGGRLGNLEPVAPFIQWNNTNKALFKNGSLADYLGFPASPEPLGITTQVGVSALPFRAYQLIYDEYFRDQNLTESIDLSKSSGAQISATELTKLTTLRQRAWEKDYFTSALPWSQRGGQAIMPMEMNIGYKGVSELFNGNGTMPTDAGLDVSAGNLTGDSGTGLRIENIDSVENVNTSINDLRKAVRLQEWLERSARGGARYIEQILSHFNVISSDARLQRPEYLGGGKNPVVISEVLNTVGTVGETDFAPQGSMSGHGISVGGQNGFQRSFEEHGFIIGIMSVLPRTAYQQGLPKMFSRTDKFDYFWPEFAHLGEQEILNQEIYLHKTNGNYNLETFGYQSRYAEYKYQPSIVNGDFRDSLSYWHMGRIFYGEPALNQEFIESSPDHRIFAVTDPTVDKLYCQIYHKIDALRPMPYFGTPIL